jgi:phage tail protein X
LISRYYTYLTLEGDTFDCIALDFYGEETQSSTIIQANLQHRKVITFSAGIELMIPIIEQSASDSLPPWKRVQ